MKRLTLLLLILAGLTACQPQTELPTAINLDAISTENAQLATANAPTATATLRDLPATFTPTPTETAIPADASTPFITSTPEGYQGLGTIFYIYNGDSVASVNANGTNNIIIATFGVGIPITDLTLSNNGELLAYVAPGGGSAREVYISNRDGSYTQKVSCLGMSDVKYVSWMADNEHLLFFAAPSPGAPGDIYMASYLGSNNCPTGNEQQLVIPIQSGDIRGLTSNRQGTIIYYSGGGDAVYAWEISTGNRAQLTNSSGYGPDCCPVGSPTDDRMVYLRFTQRPDGQRGGEMVTITNTSQMPRLITSTSGAFLQANSLMWSADGSVVVLTTPTKVYVFDFVNGTVLPLFDTILVEPDAAPRPDAREVAYTNIDANSVEQIFVYNREAEDIRQLTTNPEGTISNLVWAGDPPPQ